MFKRIKKYFAPDFVGSDKWLGSDGKINDFDVNEDLKELDTKPDNMLDGLGPTDLIRKQLKGITINFYGEVGAVEDDLSENGKKELYANAEKLRTNKSLKKIINHLINVQGNYSMKEAEIMEHVAFGRATINGLSLIGEEIDRLSDLYRDSIKREEDFDPHAGV